ncbi:MAG: hypothetical protein V4717_24365 [Bacteroidota bacterium]
MKKLIILWACILLFTGDSISQTKVEEELFGLLQQAKYKELVNKVCSLREKAYFKNAFMDYCLAYGYCQLDKPSVSAEWFDHLLASYSNFSIKKRNELKTLKQSCLNTRSTTAPTQSLFLFLQAMNADGHKEGAGIESKLGIPSLTDTVEAIDFEHLTFDGQHRRFSLQQKKEALTYYQQILRNDNFFADTTEHFLVFYPKNALNIKQQIEDLEKYYAFYAKAFNLQESGRLISIFYCTSRSNFNEVAESIHKMPIPVSTFGYASSVDLVMLGIANVAWLGAMKHELFHLMIRSYLGDIPPWLDEGTACFFESSTLTNAGASTNFSGSNYRFNLLKNTSFLRSELRHQRKGEFLVPSVQQLTNFNWLEFSGKQGDLTIKASYNQSLSYAFVCFLNEKNLLPKMIEAYRNRSFVAPVSSQDSNDVVELHLKTNDQLLTEVTGMNQQEIQQAFRNFCRKKNIILD